MQMISQPPSLESIDLTNDTEGPALTRSLHQLSKRYPKGSGVLPLLLKCLSLADLPCSFWRRDCPFLLSLKDVLDPLGLSPPNSDLFSEDDLKMRKRRDATTPGPFYLHIQSSISILIQAPTQPSLDCVGRQNPRKGWCNINYSYDVRYITHKIIIPPHFKPAHNLYDGWHKTYTNKWPHQPDAPNSYLI